MKYLITVTTDKEYDVARFASKGDALLFMSAISKTNANYKLYINGKLDYEINKPVDGTK